jgi:hypothetical protein
MVSSGLLLSVVLVALALAHSGAVGALLLVLVVTDSKPWGQERALGAGGARRARRLQARARDSSAAPSAEQRPATTVCHCGLSVFRWHSHAKSLQLCDSSHSAGRRAARPQGRDLETVEKIVTGSHRTTPSPRGKAGALLVWAKDQPTKGDSQWTLLIGSRPCRPSGFS